jgi:hypothetical protein
MAPPIECARINRFRQWPGHFLLPERGQIVDIIAAHHVAAVAVGQYSPGTPLAAMVDNHHVKPLWNRS